jgi:DNA adenine methylase
MESYSPNEFGHYHEPFLGGGAVFFSLVPRKGTPSFLSDINDELINFYKVLKSDPEGLSRRLCDLDKVYRSLSHEEREKLYYRIREMDRSPEFRSKPPVERAVRLFFLNKTAFNGLYRTNSKGYFNVPWGKYESPPLCVPTLLEEASEILQEFAVWIESADFEVVLDNASPGDFVYFDPPYVPISTTSGFTDYAPGGFGLQEQRRLASVCRELDRRNIKFMLSNSDMPVVRSLYSGFFVEVLRARRSIGASRQSRGEVNELLALNYQGKAPYPGFGVTAQDDVSTGERSH